MAHPITERDIEIWNRHQNGETLRGIAGDYDISGERVRQIIKRVQHKLSGDEVIEMHEQGMSYESIADVIRKKYGSNNLFSDSEHVRHAVVNWQKYNVSPDHRTIPHCSTCGHGIEIPNGHAVVCHHPSRRESRVFHGKLHPHDCPLRTKRPYISDLTFTQRMENARYRHNTVSANQWPVLFDDLFDALRLIEEDAFRVKSLKGAAISALSRNNSEYRDPIEVIESLVEQFALPITHHGHAALTTGGISALESAFGLLGWEDPHITPERECQWPGCHEHASCGCSTPEGFKQFCAKHIGEINCSERQGNEDGK